MPSKAPEYWPGDDLSPTDQFSLGAARGNIWIQERAIHRGYTGMDPVWNAATLNLPTTIKSSTTG